MEGDDVLNEKVSDKVKNMAMDKAIHIIGKNINTIHYKTHPQSAESLLMHTIRGMISYIDKARSPHKYKSESTSDASKYTSGILKKHRYDFTQALQNQIKQC